MGRIVRLGFDGAATFSGRRTGVQARIKKHTPHALFVHCHCHLLQLGCVQSANKTPGIAHVYRTLTTLWKHFHNSPKRAECLKEVQSVLELPEMKVISHLTHAGCHMKGVSKQSKQVILQLLSPLARSMRRLMSQKLLGSMVPSANCPPLQLYTYLTSLYHN